MNDKERFQLNLNLVALKDPSLKSLIEKTDPGSLTFCETEKNEKNLKDQTHVPPSYLYDQKGAWHETNALWQKINPSVDLIYMYGIGLGYFYTLAQHWLESKHDRYLIFIEDDLRVLCRFFETQRATDLLLDPKVKILFFRNDPSEFDRFNQKLQELSWYFVFLKFDIAAIASYIQLRKKQLFLLSQFISLISNNINTYAGEYTDLSRRVFRNVYPNCLTADQAYLANDLYGKFKNIPAFICGAGASFNKNIDLFKEHSSKALLFAGGAALSFLNHHDLNPHFGSLIDPDPPYHRYFVLSNFQTPFFYQTRVSHQVFSLVHGRKLLVEDPHAILIDGWLKEKMNIPNGHFTSSYTVSDFSFSLACLLGCNPIFLIGMDLAYTEEKYYAQGVAQSNISFDPEKLIESKDIFGNKAYTKSDWMLSSKKIALIAKENPDRIVINTTEGGIGFEGVPNMSLAEAIDKYLNLSLDLPGYIHTIFSEISALNLPFSETQKLLKEIKESLERCLRISKDMLKILNQIYHDWQAKTEEELDFSKGDFHGWETRLHTELAYQKLLAPLWDVASKMSSRRIEQKEQGKDKKGQPIRLKFNELEFYHYASEVHLNIVFEALRRSDL